MSSTEFDSSGFDAVTSFFGSEDAPISNELQVEDKVPRITSSRRRRPGVGLKSNSLDVDIDKVESVQTKEKILSVGKKRKKDEDSDDSDLMEDHLSSDEEGGRTSVVKEKKNVHFSPTLTDNDFMGKTKKKKKKGKKERMAEKVETGILNNCPTTDETSNHVDKDVDKDNRLDSAMDGSDIAYQKKKRRKTRSKQKNVRKDTRSSNDKPEHLRIGSKNYAGRALTPETRERLNLPESRTSQIRKDRATGKLHPTSEDKASDIHLGVAVDDLVVNNTVIDSGEIVGHSQQTEQKQKQKQKKKSKFKNLK